MLKTIITIFHNETSIAAVVDALEPVFEQLDGYDMVDRFNQISYDYDVVEPTKKERKEQQRIVDERAQEEESDEDE